ncbi:DNA-binding MarR family transcriptional regulator [Actinomycetospora succinea]|uniref:DNA-binding MarR family transcriptional regulator n=1 Tax=Actinomycetospora succinea TaxID=663603 RepID=A0A4R6V8E2_9PSEU|nr:MarR family transcriptional regulator [Actinomycetospora succinea]TDQ52648.1 DNA-binding MarR family transcriptional regulator [Actinomycetospora succinea]
MDERERLAASFGDMRRAMIPAFLLDLLDAVEGGDELSLTQLATLYVLDAGEPVSLGALAERVGRSHSATSRLVDALVRRGLVERQEHPTDRRVRRVAISKDGQGLLRRLERTRADAQLEIMNRLAPADRALVGRAMALLGDAAAQRQETRPS